MSERPAGHISALDGVRGLAILLVLAYHFSSWAGDSLALPLTTRSLLPGMRGVDLFFVLSGFLITGILVETRGAPEYFRSFYVRRVLRIFPIYYLVVFGVTVLGPLAAPHAEKVREVADQAGWLWTYTINIAIALRERWTFYGLNHLWSLSVEEQFYLFWPLVVWFLTNRQLRWMCGALVLVALGARAALVLGAGNPTATYVLMPCRMDALLLGALLALELRRDPVEGRAGVTSRLGPVAAVLAPILYALETVPAVGGLLPGWVAPVVFPGLWALVFTWLVGAALRRGRLAAIFDLPWLRATGRYSYGIYVYHHLLRSLFERLVPLRKVAAALGSDVLAFVAFCAVGLAISVGVAVVSFHLIEARFLALKRLFPARRTLVPAALPDAATRPPVDA